MAAQFLDRTFYFASDTPLWFPLLFLLLTALVSHWVWERGVNKKGRWMILMTILFFGLTDWLLLSLLPLLHLSYGPVGLSLLSFVLIRFIVFLFLVVARRKKLHQHGPGYKGIIGSLLIIWFFNTVISLCQIDSFYFEPFNVQTTSLTRTSPQPLSTHPIRIVQLSDLHIEQITKREERVLKEVRGLKPNIIF